MKGICKRPTLDVVKKTWELQNPLPQKYWEKSKHAIRPKMHAKAVLKLPEIYKMTPHSSPIHANGRFLELQTRLSCF